ncbi:secreted antigen 1 [Babesia caballi]|uniref:Secreted antigen 1 n=1 Tax=Babesia caballi TaxID=5871 RepID=A0AAV4LN69_BABCB|nr:secreted antigen 1 [Babesia caballi]
MSTCDGDLVTPQTLKDVLDFLTALNENSELKKQVEMKLKAKAEHYFTNVDDFTKGISVSLEDLLYNARTLRTYIRGSNNNAGENYFKIRNLGKDCAESCVDVLIGTFPRLHCTLYYLRFNVDPYFSAWGGGKWSTFTCNRDNNLNKWLKSGIGISPARGSYDTLFPGGYSSNELGNSVGRDLINPLQSLVGYSSAGALQLLLSYLLFSVPGWYHSDTATAVAFVKVFCKEVAEDSGLFRRKVANYPKLIGACKMLTENLHHITGLPDRAAMLVAMCQKSVERYKSILKVEAFDYYVTGLKKKLSSVTHNLESMTLHSKYWKATDLEVAKYAGPFPYGFMFGEAWKRYQWYNAGEKLHDAIKKLWDKGSGGGGSFPDLIEALSSSSGVSGSHSISNPRSSEPGSDGPRKPASSGSLSASLTTANAAGTATPAQTTPTNSESTAPTTSSRSRNSATNSVGQISPEARESPRGASDATPVASVSSDSTITIGSAAGGVAILGGGGAALYFLNVGGIKTLITGVP